MSVRLRFASVPFGGFARAGKLQSRRSSNSPHRSRSQSPRCVIQRQACCHYFAWRESHDDLRLTLPAPAAPAETNAKPGELLVYVGTYSGPKSEGIYAYRLDLASGKCTPLGLAAKVKNPSFVAVHPTQKFLYSVSEIEDRNGKPTGGVSASSRSIRKPASSHRSTSNRAKGAGRVT